MKPQIETLDINSLIPYARNARTHSEAQIAQIAGSIKEFGFTNPILIDKDNGIIAGHGRVAAARKLNLTEVPCIRLEHLSETQRKAYILADNRIALNSGWETELLSTELEELKDLGINLESLGFDSDEIDALLNKIEPTAGLTDEDDAPEVQEQAVTKPGDIWVMGNHRLMCGDSTSIDAVDKLMAGQKADMVFTDPPYNVAMQRSATIKNDNLSDDDFEALLAGAFSCASASAEESAPWFVWIGWRAWSICDRVLSKYKQVRNCIVWAKPSIGLGQPGYRYQHEIGLFCGQIEDRSASDLWSFPRDRAGLHPTMKPVELVEHGFNTAGKRGDIVLDLFGGSGSSLIACEKTNRFARLMELDPKYCDVIVKRWQQFTGKKAILEQTGQTYEELTQLSGLQNE